MAGGRITGSMRRAARLTNKTKLLICRGTESIDVDQAEEILWDTDSADAPKHQHVGAMGVETGEMLVRPSNSIACMHR
jgi:enhancer of polycomb-like protein